MECFVQQVVPGAFLVTGTLLARDIMPLAVIAGSSAVALWLVARVRGRRWGLVYGLLALLNPAACILAMSIPWTQAWSPLKDFLNYPFLDRDMLACIAGGLVLPLWALGSSLRQKRARPWPRLGLGACLGVVALVALATWWNSAHSVRAAVWESMRVDALHFAALRPLAARGGIGPWKRVLRLRLGNDTPAIEELAAQLEDWPWCRCARGDSTWPTLPPLPPEGQRFELPPFDPGHLVRGYVGLSAMIGADAYRQADLGSKLTPTMSIEPAFAGFTTYRTWFGQWFPMGAWSAGDLVGNAALEWLSQKARDSVYERRRLALAARRGHVPVFDRGAAGNLSVVCLYCGDASAPAAGVSEDAAGTITWEDEAGVTRSCRLPVILANVPE